MLPRLVTSCLTAFSESQNSSSFTVPENFITAGFTKAHYRFLKSWIQFIYWHNISIKKSPFHLDLCLTICLCPSRVQLGAFFMYSSRATCSHLILLEFIAFIIFDEITKNFVGPFYLFSSYFPWFRYSNIPLSIFYHLPSINVPFLWLNNNI
jgi:hypothetical protein